MTWVRGRVFGDSAMKRTANKKSKKSKDFEEEEFDFFAIDRTRLDDEWIRQPQLYFDQAVKAAQAKELVDRAKAALEVATADLGQLIRLKPKKYGLAKVTEAGIAQCLKQQQLDLPEYEQYVKARYNADVYNAAVFALDQRKKALENLVQLELANYHSEPRIKGATREDASNMKDRLAYRKVHK